VDELLTTPTPQGVNWVEDALKEAERAKSPADALGWMFAAVKLQQQQIAALELAVGIQDTKALEDIRARAKRTESERVGLKLV
jgi:hypothetical protein